MSTVDNFARNVLEQGPTLVSQAQIRAAAELCRALREYIRARDRQESEARLNAYWGDVIRALEE